MKPRKPSRAASLKAQAHSWAIYRMRHKAELVGHVEAPSEAEAIRKAIDEFKIAPPVQRRLLARRD